jgi:hypothetical protein
VAPFILLVAVEDGDPGLAQFSVNGTVIPRKKFVVLGHDLALSLNQARWGDYGKAGAALRVSAWIAFERIAAGSASFCARVRAQKNFDWAEFEQRRGGSLGKRRSRAATLLGAMEWRWLAALRGPCRVDTSLGRPEAWSMSPL